MNRSLTLILSLTCAWLSLGLVLRGEPLELTPQEGILVLRSGGIVRGVITRAGSEYYVGVQAGEIRLNADEVELVCSSLDEAYRIKAAALPTGHVTEHVELAEWCLRQNLLGYAAREVLAARNADPSFSKLELLERRLDLAMNPVEPFKASALKKQPVVEKQQQRNAAEETVSRLPPRLVESFSTTIQPMLVNGCSNAACHGTTSNNKLRLERLALGRPVSHRITERNLASVLTCIDMENAAASPILTLPLGAHGTAAEAVLTSRDLEKYRLLVAWVTEVTRNMAPAAPNNVSLPAGPLLQTINGPRKAYGVRVAKSTISSTPFKSAESEVPQETIAEPVATPQLENSPSPFEPETSYGSSRSALPTPAATLRQAQEQKGHKFGAPREKPSSQDPFDPDLFNSQFGSQPE